MPPSQTPDTGRGGDRRFQIRFLLGSVAFNGLLLALLLFTRGRKEPIQGPSNTDGSEMAVTGHPGEVRARRSGKDSLPSPPTIWSQLASTNLGQYAANLRQAGCPEVTVCDLLTPLIQRTLEEAVRRTRFQGDYWAVGSERRRLREKGREDRVARYAERDRLLKSLGCQGGPVDRMLDGEVRLMIDLVTGFLGLQAQEQLMALVMGGESEGQSIRERFGRVLLPEDLVEMRNERDQFQERLNALISAEQMEELEARLLYLGQNDDSLDGSLIVSLRLTPGELREYCRIQASGERHPLEELNPYDSLLGEESPRRDSASVHADVRALLGEERYAEYHRRSDRVFQAAESLVKEFGQTADLPGRVHEVVEQLRAEVPKLRGLWAADREAGRLQLMERRDAFRQQLEAILSGVPEERRRELLSEWTDGVVREKWNRQ